MWLPPAIETLVEFRGLTCAVRPALAARARTQDWSSPRRLRTESNSVSEADFSTHINTVWRDGTPNETPPAAVASPMVAVTGGLLATPVSATPSRHRRVAQFLTPARRERAQVSVTLLLLRPAVRDCRWRTIDMERSDTASELGARAALVWATGELALFRRLRNGSVAVVGGDEKLKDGCKVFAVELRAPAHPAASMRSLATHGVYHVMADANGRLRSAFLPLIAATLDQAKSMVATTVTHRNILLAREVLAVSWTSGSGGTCTRLNAIPMPTLECTEGTTRLACDVAVIHPSLRPGDMVRWHLPTPPILCTVMAIGLRDGLIAVTVKPCDSARSARIALAVDLERV